MLSFQSKELQILQQYYLKTPYGKDFLAGSETFFLAGFHSEF